MRLARIWFDTPGIRWRTVWVTAALLSLLAGLWIGLARGLWPGPEPVEAVVLSAAAPAAPASAVIRPRVAAPRAAASGVPVVARAPASVAPGERNSTEVCGLGTLPLGPAPDAQAAVAGLVQRAAALRERWLAALQGSGDERLRAAGWLLALPADASPASGSNVARERLAALAAETRDPLVLAYGLQACRGEAARAGGCALLVPTAWPRLEPDNAAAWLAVAADPRSETAARAEALQRAARATRVDSHAAALQTLTRSLQPPGATELDRLLIAREVATASAGWHSVAALPALCDAAALKEPTRRADCQAIAELLIERAPTLHDLREAGELGERLGWPAERSSALRSEADALERAHDERFELAADPLACAALPARNAYFADVGRLGEVGALRQARQRAAR